MKVEREKDTFIDPSDAIVGWIATFSSLDNEEAELRRMAEDLKGRKIRVDA